MAADGGGVGAADETKGFVSEITGSPCVGSTIRGAGIGGLLGGGFHAVAGPTATVIGQPGLKARTIIRQGAIATGRIAGVFGLFTVVRCGLQQKVGLDNAIGSCIAGGTAVGIATAFDKSRIEFLEAYFADAMKGAGFKGKPTVGFVISVSAFSGAIMLGGLDTVLKHTGMRW